MDARFYNAEDIDIERLANDITNVYIAQGYQAQQFGSKDQMLVQLKKGGDFEAIIGMQAAVSLTIQRTAGGILALIGQQKWLDKAAVGTIGIVAFPVLWPLALTAGAGALRQASLGNQVLNMVDNLVRQQRPGVMAGPIPVQLMPQVQQQWGAPPYGQTPQYVPSQQYVTVTSVPPQTLPAPAQLRCPSCNTPYEAGDTFCSGCGRTLAPPKVHCPNCNTELKPGVAYCPKCGSSTFQGTQSRPAVSAYTPPPAQPPVRPVQPPPAPVYTPPPAQPPVQPAPTVYYTPPVVPSEPSKVEPYAAPTVAQPKPVPPKPAPAPYYVPSATQTPSAPAQPKVTLVPGQPKPEPAAPTPPERPPVQYYVPSSAAQEQTVQAPVPPQPLTAHSVSQPVDTNAPWGALLFADGKRTELAGENAVVGRYDHDLGGDKPAVDLSDMQGADTVSRIHAAFEHIGSTFTLTDLNSTNATRINGKRLEPDKATPLNDGDALAFGKVTCTFKKL